MSVKFDPLPENDVAVITPVVFTLESDSSVVAVSALPVKSPVIVVKVGVSVNLIVAPIPDAVAVKLPLTKFISPTEPADPTRDPSSLIETPANEPTCPAVKLVKFDPSP